MLGLSDQKYLRSGSWPHAAGVNVVAKGGGMCETEAGLVVPESSVPNLPLAMDLFCGCGGMSLGAIAAGFDVIAGADNDFPSAVTYLSNLATYPCQIVFVTEEDRDRFNEGLEKDRKKYRREHGVDGLHRYCGSARRNQEYLAPGYRGVRYFFFGDLTKARGEDILGVMGLERGDLGMVMGGPPCQGFSKLGNQDPNDPRNNLTFTFARLVVEMAPEAMMMENVPEITSQVTPWGTSVMDELMDILEKGDFTAHDRVRKLWAGDQEGRKALRRRKKERTPENEEEQKQASLFEGISA